MTPNEAGRRFAAQYNTDGQREDQDGSCERLTADDVQHAAHDAWVAAGARPGWSDFLAGFRSALAQSRPSPPGPDAGELREALEEAQDMLGRVAERFRFYEREHRNKGTAEADVKARANRDYALGCETCKAIVDAALRTSEEGAGRG